TRRCWGRGCNRGEPGMLGVAIAVAAVGFILKAFAAAGTGWFLVPLAAVACICHVVVHARAARAAGLPVRLAMLSNIFLIGALLMQMEFTPGYNCAEDTLSSMGWRPVSPGKRAASSSPTGW